MQVDVGPYIHICVAYLSNTSGMVTHAKPTKINS